MITFIVCVGILIAGYFIYGTFVDKTFGPDERATPAVADPDGVDYIPMNSAKGFLVQLLNIAGLGPIFGAVSGALWGPSVYLWIVFGTIFAGAVHDYLSGMLSLRNDGATTSEITGKYLGPVMKNVMRVFSVVLLVMVGVVFMVGPAGLLARITPDFMTTQVWTVIILIYYFLATVVPVDKIIGKIYPIFGLFLIVMALGVSIMTIANSGTRPMMELDLTNIHPKGTPIWPIMFITVACGAISGFHATQSPIIARTIKSEKEGRKIFYGAMVAEGIIAMIWASAGIAFFYNKDGANTGLQALQAIGGGNANSIHMICTELLGVVGGAIALIGVIVCPITSGDTAFRSARMVIFDWFGFDDRNMKTRLALAVPLLAIGYLISKVDYQIVWRYFSWSNQTLAMIVLWAGAVYLATNNKNKNSCWVAAVPATFMSAVSVTYFMYAGECLNLQRLANGQMISYIIGAAAAVIFLAIFVATAYSHPEKSLERQNKEDITRAGQGQASA